MNHFTQVKWFILFLDSSYIASLAFLPLSTSAASIDELPAVFLPYEQFAQEFSLGTTATEQVHERTKTLSQTLQADVVQGLRMLLEADKEVVAGLKRFIPTAQSLAPQLASRIASGGRIFLVGSGSSGRVAVDLAAKCNRVLPGRVWGVIAGGDSAMVRAKEGFEDSAKNGEQALQHFQLQPNDTVILISASGSASFNVGCGHFAANQGAKVFYFYNSVKLPDRTQQLFKRPNNPVIPLELDIGPQSISGSTRLQGASVAELGLGALLSATLFHDRNDPNELVSKMEEGNLLIGRQLEKIADIVNQEAAVFNAPGANFRRLRDETSQGYVTYLGDKNTFREILIDATETSPTFSTNPIRRENETNQKRAEFCAYLTGEPENRKAWRELLGREIVDGPDIDQFVIAAAADGKYSYENRPKGTGNFLLGVAKVDHLKEIDPELLSLIEKEKGRMIVLSRTKGSLPPNLQTRTVFLQEVPSDPLGVVETVLLKQILNLISNGSMVLMNKVQGNQMIDVRGSNQKLIDRVSRLIQEIWQDTGRAMPLSQRELYHWIAHISSFKKRQADLGIYTPSLVKIALALLHLGHKKPVEKELQEATRFLADRQERLEFLERGYTLCIDGGGSKTLLQIVDPNGKVATLYRKGEAVEKIEAGASNINFVKKEGVKAALSDLFSDLKVGQEKCPLSELIPTARVIAGMAGVSIPENIEAITFLFSEWGIRKERLQLMTDAELALRLLKGNGIVLIAGTGSICFAEKEGVKQRVGGFGRVLGDEGSGYQIGLSALKAGLEEEFGYGPSTRLTPALRALFKVAELRCLFPKINSFEISAAEIALAAPLVFEQAEAKDPVAIGIISRAADDLQRLIDTALKISELRDCQLHLWGGVFKGAHADLIVKKLREATSPRGIQIVNQSAENAALIFAQTFW